MQKIIQCKMTGQLVELPCSASGCPLFGDCISKYTEITKASKTNADRIRFMTDEELAQHFSGMICDINEGVVYHENPSTWLEWLQQPAEEVR